MNLTLCLTHDCNLRCGYCYAGRKSAKSMPWNVACAAIDFALDDVLLTAVKYQRKPELILGFFGGEPLLEWDLLRRCHDYAEEKTRENGIIFRSTLTTNMTLLDEEKAAWLKTRNYYLGLSMDGNADMHHVWRTYAGGRHSHDDCIRALQYFRDANDKAEIIMVVDPGNVSHLSESVRWLSRHSPLKMILNPNYGARWDEQSQQILRLEYEKVADYYKDCFRKNHPIHINVLDGKIKTHLSGGYRDCDLCSFGEKEIAVSASGHFYPCARLVGEDDNTDLRFGNVYEGYDHAKRIRYILERGNKTEACSHCTLRSRCMSWCGCVNYVTSNGQINQVGSFTCFHERLSIELADRVASTLWEEKNPSFLARFYQSCLKQCAITPDTPIT